MIPQSSKYIEEQRREFSLYTLQSRAIPHLADGLKVSHRRVLWMAKNGDTFKTATLAGATMCIHPHSAPEDSINTLAAPFGNNIPLFTGEGAFGTFLHPFEYGAGRYTSVSVSNFTKDVIFKDLDIVPLVNNYDDTKQEPKHFLPIVPISLINPVSGIAVGFACNILPRSLKDIIISQINYLKGKKVYDSIPYIKPYDQTAVDCITDTLSGNIKWVFSGKVKKQNDTTVQVTNLPYGQTYGKFIDRLESLEEDGTIISFIDASKEHIDVLVKFPKGVLAEKTEDDIIKTLKLTNSESENFNVIDFDGDSVVQTSFVDCVSRFTEWRLQWYINRYENLLNILQQDIQKYKDILLAIKNNIGSIARKIDNRSELVNFITEIGIVNVDYIASLPVYRFTIEEKKKTETKLADALETEKHYLNVLSDEVLRKEIYITELQEIQSKYCKK